VTAAHLHHGGLGLLVALALSGVGGCTGASFVELLTARVFTDSSVGTHVTCARQ
jgi:hypothetical protein